MSISSFAQAQALRGSGPELERNLPDGFNRLSLGDAAPDFDLIGVDDRRYRLDDFAQHRFLLVVFLSNHCPYSHAAESRMIPWINRMKAAGLGVVAIQPNNPDAITVDELGYSKYSDSFEEMKLYAAENHFTFPYLYDGEKQETAKSYGALATPDLFLFDADRKLRYSGRFDDSRFEDPATVTKHDAVNALADMIAGDAVTAPYARPMGCAIKWLTKVKQVTKKNEAAWSHEPITLAPIDAAGVAELAANRTNKLRLVNLWATWCGPCVDEFPELTKFSRRLKRRDFEVITISMDHPSDQPKALRFLQNHHAGMPARIADSLAMEGRTTNNYIFTDASTDALAANLDPSWPGPIPHTVLIAPGGEVLWTHNGVFDEVALGRLLLDQLGGFYPEGEGDLPVKPWKDAEE
ncbi:redoxin domain-containing protein [Synoicihabitans lomoniglobus]|uniref:Redoxin domain-containing protein n=1 Tax=Synoicihabitans lomoniglobus TaxID=2909285 RepID=A0AAF0A1M2_9BACT|nr:redoxin domain-containing protein [Opitutaceae bacterium LMO-M01]WED65152.1 redoxin domain-containing protein [Opitutaceae bacterium LMO-M01]